MILGISTLPIISITLLLFLIFRFILNASLLSILRKWGESLENLLHLHQSYKVPLYNQQFQENQLYRKILMYLNSLPSLEDSDSTNLFSGSKPNEIFLRFDTNQTIHDKFLGAKVSWTTENPQDEANSALVLRIKKKDKRRIFRQYFQHILTAVDEIEQRRREIKLYMNVGIEEKIRWRSFPFTHPASFDTVVMDSTLKQKVISDLQQFSKSKQFYHRLGRVWKRSYLLYGNSRTGNSNFIAAMAKFLGYDVYDMDISNKIMDDSDLKMLLLQTTNKSIIVVEGLDRFLSEKPGAAGGVTLYGILNLVDGLVSSCGEERVMVFTMNGIDGIDQEVMRPGKIEVHIHFPPCDFSLFKSLACSYLGVKEHKLFGQVEEIFRAGASLSPDEIGEIMMSNRNSPTRAFKSIIMALKLKGRGDGPSFSESGSGRSSSELSEHGGVLLSRESSYAARELRKLYGLLRFGSRKKEESNFSGPI